MRERWYATDGSAQLERQQHSHNARDGLMADMLRGWLQTKDPREPMGVILLTQYPDGFSVQYLGREHIDADELVRRVVWLGDSMKAAASG